MTSTSWTRHDTDGGGQPLSLIHQGTDPDDFEAWLAERVDDALTGRTPAQLHSLAERYVRLREAVTMTMPDWTDWADEQGRLSVTQLAVYIDHLTQAVRGRCAVCDRTIYAPHTVTRLPERDGWRRWWQAAVEIGRGVTEAWNLLRYGECRTAHADCQPQP